MDAILVAFASEAQEVALALAAFEQQEDLGLLDMVVKTASMLAATGVALAVFVPLSILQLGLEAQTFWQSAGLQFGFMGHTFAQSAGLQFAVALAHIFAQSAALVVEVV